MRTNVEEQLERLVKQLEDLENYRYTVLNFLLIQPNRNSSNRNELDQEEYQETKAETLEQMREFQSSLTKLAAGDLSLTDYFASIQLVLKIGRAHV